MRAITHSNRIAKLLIEKGADVNAKSDQGNTPLHYIMKSSKNKDLTQNREALVKLLIDNGADPHIANDNGETPVDFLDLDDSTNKMILNMVMNDLFSAIRNDDLELVSQLIGDDVNKKYSNDTTALHVAAFYDAIEVARNLVEKGADINAKNYMDYTPLHFAAINDSSKVASFLIKSNANRDAVGNDGMTPIECAKKGNANQVIPLLGINLLETTAF